VVANDVDLLALTATHVNARANDVEVEVLPGDVLLPADPPAPQAEAEGLLDGLDVVLAGDVFYDRELAGDVLPFLQRAAERGAKVLVGDPDRRYLPRALLLPLARYDVPVSRDLESSDLATVTVWWLPSRTEGGA
jgi:predicted nicotinamide N-methyase